MNAWRDFWIGTLFMLVSCVIVISMIMLVIGVQGA